MTHSQRQPVFRFFQALCLALLVLFSGTISGQATRASSVQLYYVAIGDAGKGGLKFGCGDSLVAVTRPVAPTKTPLATSFQLLLSDHRRYIGQSGLYNVLYRSRLTLESASIVHGSTRIAITGRMSLGGECDNPRVSAQLRHTALQFKSVNGHKLTITINGVPLSKRLSLKG
jgi:hypothetical protein